MTENQIIILSVSIGIFLIQALFTAISYWVVVDTRFRHFYITPVIAVTKTMANDYRFKNWETILFTVCYYIFVTSLIIPVWFIAWCLYKFWKFIYVDDTIEQKIEEEIREQSINTIKEEENVEQDKASLYTEQMEKDLENPEYINKDEKSDAYFRSQEFLNYLHDKNNNGIIDCGIDLAQTPDTEINKVVDVKNTSTIDNEDDTKVEQEVKPKRKYNKKKKIENNDDNNETKNN